MDSIKIMKNVIIGATVGVIDDPRALAAVDAAVKEAQRRQEILTMYLMLGYPGDVARRMIASFEENGHDPIAMLQQLGPHTLP